MNYKLEIKSKDAVKA